MKELRRIFFFHAYSVTYFYVVEIGLDFSRKVKPQQKSSKLFKQAPFKEAYWHQPVKESFK